MCMYSVLIHDILTKAVQFSLTSVLTLLVGRQGEHPACKNWVMGCWCGYLSVVKCRLFAYGPADATAVPNTASSACVACVGSGWRRRYNRTFRPACFTATWRSCRTPLIGWQPTNQQRRRRRSVQLFRRARRRWSAFQDSGLSCRMRTPPHHSQSECCLCDGWASVG